MELKDVILSTLAEMEDTPPVKQTSTPSFEIKEKKELDLTVEEKPETLQIDTEQSNVDSELVYLNSIKERLLVLFEGFQAPNNANIEAKVDMTLNFLEYTLATISDRVEILEKGNKQ